MHWPFLALGYEKRPSRNTSESSKDKDYHNKTARHYLSNVNQSVISGFRAQYYQNSEFYKGRQWKQADVETYLMDGKKTTQLSALKRNVITPMVTRTKGAVRNMSIDVEVMPRTQRTKTRKETELARMLVLADAANTSNVMKAAIKSQNPIVGDSEEETVSMFENHYQDKFARGVSNMLDMIALFNRFEDRKEDEVERLMLSGVCVEHASIHGNHIVWDFIEPDEFIYDSKARLADMTDAEWLCVAPKLSVPAIAERYNPDPEVLEVLEEAQDGGALDQNETASRGGNNNYHEGRPRVFTIYWRDVRRVKRAYVMKDDVPCLEIIGENDPETGKPKYTEADIVDPPTEALYAEEFRGKKSKTVYVEQVRYCTFIPYEYAPGVRLPGSSKIEKTTIKDAKCDLVLDYGVYPLQEDDPFDSARVGFPIKVVTWAFLDGEIMAPITDAIDPQRFINRVQSVVELHLRKLRPKKTVIDTRALDKSVMGEDAIRKADKEGDILMLDGKNGGINQAYGEVGGGMDAGTASMFDVIARAVDDANANTGINAPAQGQANTEAVGITAMLLQQTNIMLMPVFGALQELAQQRAQFNAQAGRSWYWRNPAKLEEMIGDEDLAAVIASKDTMLEKWRVEAKVVMDDQVRLQQGRELLTQFIQLGLIDKKTFADLYGRATIEEVVKGVRKYVQQEIEAAKAQNRQNAIAQQAAALAQQEMDLNSREDQLYDQAVKQAGEMDKANAKLALPVVSSQAKAAFQPEGQDSNNRPMR